MRQRQFLSDYVSYGLPLPFELCTAHPPLEINRGFPLQSVVARPGFDREEYFFSTLYELPLVKKILLEGRQSFVFSFPLFCSRSADVTLVVVF